MARKLEKSKRKEEGYRRSPRICDAWKAHRPRRVGLTSATLKMECDSSPSQTAQGPASRTRSRKKRKLRPLQEVASTSASPPLTKGSEKSRYEDHQANSDQGVLQDKDCTKHEKQDSWPARLSKPCLPKKRLLEVILDILQRRDTHEIFAEPVDPEEVEDYYEIIKEPMDFGTMRAKLHEGMYQSFEQFEHDVFLITKNAMHFNSSATIYFRQARAINELATKVFHVLKTNPESFELEFLDSRRRNSRRPQGEAGNSVYRTRPRIARNVKSSSMVIDESSKPMSCSLTASSNIRRSMPVRNGCFGFNTNLDANDHKVPCGTGDDGRSGYTETYRRCTYEPSMSFLDENESIFSIISGNKKRLELVIHQDISYKESLMLFAKDLGPVVQTIAKRKLLGWFPVQNNQFSMTSSSNHQEPSAWDTVFTAPLHQNSLDQNHSHPNVVPNYRGRMDFEGDTKGEKMNMGDKMATTRPKVQGGSDTTNPSVYLSDKLHQNQSSDNQFCSSGDFNFNSSFSGFKNTGNTSTTAVDNIEARTLELAFEYSHFNSIELGLKNVDTSNFSHSEVSMTKLSPCNLGEDNHGRGEQGRFFVVSSSHEASRCKTPTSQFIFDLPYLRARLGQTNSLGQDTFLQQHNGSEVTLLRNE